MTPIFFDTHAHLDDPVFAADMPQLVERAEAAGIARIITIGTDFDSSAKAIEIAEKFPCVFAAVGWHPGQATDAPDDVRGPLRDFARHPKVVAIGETGLDYLRFPAPDAGGSPADIERIKRKQAAIFRQQLEVAAETRLNCVIHQREALEDSLAILGEFASQVRGVFHCFVNDPATVHHVLALNSIVSFTGIATFKNAATVRDSLAAVPADSFMLETDSPYLAPVPHRGKRCEPAYVRPLAEFVAAHRNCSLDQLSADTCATAAKFFPKLILPKASVT
jgi:TatD DNase family protein